MEGRLAIRPARFPAVVLVLWLAATLGWWAFAFAPLPADPPPWLTAARSACFGAIESGLPGAAGWILLVVAPATFLAAIVVLWGADLAASLRHAARGPVGWGVIAVLGLAVVAQATWVGRRVRAAQTVEAWDPRAPDPAGLPAGYPRQAAAAPAFALVDQHGATVSPDRFRGRPVVLSFVFAHCQSMCPLVVDRLKQATPAGVHAEVLLVTLDPWRDTPSALPGIARQWAVPAHFHVLSSRSVDEVVGVARAYRVPFERHPTTGEIVHPGLVFVLDPEGRLAYTFNNPPPDWIRDSLRRLGPVHAPVG